MTRAEVLALMLLVAWCSYLILMRINSVEQTIIWEGVKWRGALEPSTEKAKRQRAADAAKAAYEKVMAETETEVSETT